MDGIIGVIILIVLAALLPSKKKQNGKAAQVTQTPARPAPARPVAPPQAQHKQQPLPKVAAAKVAPPPVPVPIQPLGEGESSYEGETPEEHDMHMSLYDNVLTSTYASTLPFSGEGETPEEHAAHLMRSHSDEESNTSHNHETLLGKREDLKKAIIMSEILSKPVSLRSRAR